MNKAVEELCDRHKFVKKQESLTQLKSTRLNVMGDRVDINAIKKLEKLKAKE